MPGRDVRVDGTTVPRTSNIALALEILEQVARHRTGVTANDISRTLDVPRATVYRIVNSLVQDEFLLRRPDLRGFILGSRVVELAHLVAVPTEPATAHDGVLEAIRQQTGEAIHFARFDDGAIVVVAEDPRGPISDQAAFASDPARSAIGHLLLAELPVAAAASVSSATVDDIAEIAQAAAVREYTQQIGLLSPGRACIAVAVRSPDGALVGALALATSVSRISTAARHLGLLRQAAATLALGARVG